MKSIVGLEIVKVLASVPNHGTNLDYLLRQLSNRNRKQVVDASLVLEKAEMVERDKQPKTGKLMGMALIEAGKEFCKANRIELHGEQPQSPKSEARLLKLKERSDRREARVQRNALIKQAMFEEGIYRLEDVLEYLKQKGANTDRVSAIKRQIRLNRQEKGDELFDIIESKGGVVPSRGAPATVTPLVKEAWDIGFRTVPEVLRLHPGLNPRTVKSRLRRFRQADAIAFGLPKNAKIEVIDARRDELKANPAIAELHEPEELAESEG